MDKSTEERLGIAETEVNNLKDSDKDQWDAINELRRFMHKLVPVWTVIVLMTASSITASALTFAAMMIRMSGK